MLSDEELKALARAGDWGRLEIEARGASAQRVSKSAEIHLLRALLEQGKLAELEPAAASSLAKWPRATLRFLEREEKRIPQLYRKLTDSSVFSDLNVEAPPDAMVRRTVWPAADVLADRDRVAAFLSDEVFANVDADIRPLAKEQVHVLTFGSCFAQNLYNRLLARDVRASTLSVEEAVNTTFANRDILRFLHEGRVNRTADAVFGDADKAPVRDKLLLFLRHASHVVLTVGVAPAFFFRNGEYALLSGAREIVRNRDQIAWRMTTVAENRDNLAEAIALIREMNRSVTIFLTLSPVPLSTSFSPAGVVYEDLLSKATLRVAIAEVMQAGIERVHYWPSFEAVKWLASHAEWAGFGGDDRITRHPSRWLVDVIIEAFCRRIIAA
jgi:hypothetical protein